MRPIAYFAGALVALFALPALAQSQDGTPTRVRGKVEKLDGQTLLVHSRDGQKLTVALAAETPVLGLKRAKFSDIKDGTFIGTAALPGKDGKLHSEEIVVFPDAMRGTGEGHYPWDLKGGNETMTNATVAQVESASKGKTHVLKLKYKDGEKEIVVDKNIPIVTFAPDDRKLLKKGAAVFIPGVKKPDGTVVARAVIAEKNGVKPPM